MIYPIYKLAITTILGNCLELKFIHKYQTAQKQLDVATRGG
jgi:hypothetical protein